MSRRFQFSLRALLRRMFVIAAVAALVGYLLRLPTQVRAAGTVTLDGATVSGAQIRFVCGNVEEGSCTTDAAGRFAIVLLPGSYNVTVTKKLPTGPMRDAHSGEPVDPTKDKWFWVVTFQETMTNGRPTHLKLVVLMDGRVLKPKIREWKPRTSE